MNQEKRITVTAAFVKPLIPFKQLTPKYEGHTRNVVAAPDHFFRMEIILKIVCVKYRADENKEQRNEEPCFKFCEDHPLPVERHVTCDAYKHDYGPEPSLR